MNKYKIPRTVKGTNVINLNFTIKRNETQKTNLHQNNL